MLSNIHIENIAVIKNIDVDLSDGFCAITGETGAGKSVIMDAVRMLAGGKVDRELIRHGEERAEITGFFSGIGESVAERLRELGFSCEDGELLMSRTFTRDGRSGVKINGKSATAAMQKSIAGQLIDFHSQHDNITLLDKKTHMRMLDEYADTASELSLYREKYGLFMTAKKNLSEHLSAQKNSSAELDFIKAQIKDIEGVKPKPGEDEKLEAERVRLSSVERIKKQAGFAYRALYGGERGNACMLVDKSMNALSAVSDAVPEFEALSGRLKDVYYELTDIARSVEELSDAGADPTASLEKVEARLDAIIKLKKKYSADIPDILLMLEELKKKADTYENSEEIEKELKKEYKKALSEIEAAARGLREKRISAAVSLSESVCGVLDFLDMPKVRFEVRVTDRTNAESEKAKSGGYGADGADDVVFMLSLSSAEPFIELSGASGGELSRVMLALKSVLCEKYGSQTVIYDEIDAGVSGKTARKIGIKLKESSSAAQVICVTHSAQIASLADVHYKITKNAEDGRFESSIVELDRDGRVDELSRILGGLNVTAAQRQAALDMLEGGE